MRCECQHANICKYKDAIEKALTPIIDEYGGSAKLDWLPNPDYKKVTELVKKNCSARKPYKK